MTYNWRKCCKKTHIKTHIDLIGIISGEISILTHLVIGLLLTGYNLINTHSAFYIEILLGYHCLFYIPSLVYTYGQLSFINHITKHEEYSIGRTACFWVIHFTGLIPVGLMGWNNFSVIQRNWQIALYSILSYVTIVHFALLMYICHKRCRESGEITFKYDPREVTTPLVSQAPEV
jgi:tellurite resistance protein TehA-like permease